MAGLLHDELVLPITPRRRYLLLPALLAVAGVVSLSGTTEATQLRAGAPVGEHDVDTDTAAAPSSTTVTTLVTTTSTVAPTTVVPAPTTTPTVAKAAPATTAPPTAGPIELRHLHVSWPTVRCNEFGERNGSIPAVVNVVLSAPGTVVLGWSGPAAGDFATWHTSGATPMQVGRVVKLDFVPYRSILSFNSAADLQMTIRATGDDGRHAVFTQVEPAPQLRCQDTNAPVVVPG